MTSDEIPDAEANGSGRPGKRRVAGSRPPPVALHLRRFDARRVDPRLRLAMRILEFEQAALPSVEEVASRVGMSTFHFARAFAEQIGESSASYSRRIRLDHANGRMFHDPAPLDVIAVSFGYANQAAFTRAYKRQFGSPPTKFMAEKLGRSWQQYVARRLGREDDYVPTAPLIAGPVHVVTRPTRPAVARRFFGPDLAAHWDEFLKTIPPRLLERVELAGMRYDNFLITPAHHLRYDCVIVLPDLSTMPAFLEAGEGLDPVEVPGGVYAETVVNGSFADILIADFGLSAEWLRRHREYQPEGDPFVHWVDSSPLADRIDARATIRIYPRGEPAASNLRPLTRRGGPAGRRTLLFSD